MRALAKITISLLLFSSLALAQWPLFNANNVTVAGGGTAPTIVQVVANSNAQLSNITFGSLTGSVALTAGNSLYCVYWNTDNGNVTAMSIGSDVMTEVVAKQNFTLTTMYQGAWFKGNITGGSATLNVTSTSSNLHMKCFELHNGNTFATSGIGNNANTASVTTANPSMLIAQSTIKSSVGLSANFGSNCANVNEGNGSTTLPVGTCPTGPFFFYDIGYLSEASSGTFTYTIPSANNGDIILVAITN